MNPGTFTDASGATWAIERRLGRGTWSTTWLVRDDQERTRVLTTALGPDDLAEQQVAPAALFEACRAAVRHEITRLTTADDPAAPRLLAHGELADGRPAFVTPSYPDNLVDKLDNAPLSEVLELLGALTRRLAVAGGRGWVHGNLHAGNVLLDERGDIVLVDPMPTALTSWRTRLWELRGARPEFLPPEAAGTPHAGWDTWAVCALAWRASSASGPGHTVPSGGLDKLSLARLRDAALSRLKASSANPRFAPRAAERLATLLHRGLSRETEPSPPYRFRTTMELAERLGEVVGLINPRLDQVGRVLLDRPTGQGTFSSEEAVRFSVTVTPSCRLATDEIAAAVRLQDLDKGQRVPVPDSRFTVKAHPTGRLRFAFELPGVAPGRYQVKVAFLIKDSSEQPATSETELEVRPAPGWVPPREETPVSSPLQLPRAVRAPRPTSPRAPTDSAPAVVQALFPAPLAPTPPPSDPDVEEEVADLAAGRSLRPTARSHRGPPPRLPATPRPPTPQLTSPAPGRVVALAQGANAPMILVAPVQEEEPVEEALPAPSETEPDLLHLAALEEDPVTQPRATPVSARIQRERSPAALPPPPPPPRLPPPTPVVAPTPVMARPSLGPSAGVQTPVDFEADTHADEAPASDWDPQHDPFFAEQPTYREPDALPHTLPQPLASEDLIGWREKVKLPDLGVQLPPWAERGLDLLRNDTYSALMAGILVVFIMLFLLILALS